MWMSKLWNKIEAQVARRGRRGECLPCTLVTHPHPKALPVWVGVVEREEGGSRGWGGKEGRGKMPLLRASSPADPSRHPRPLVPTKAREPRPIPIGAHGSSTAKPHRTWGSPPHPTAEETIPTPTFNHLQTTQDNRHPG